MTVSRGVHGGGGEVAQSSTTAVCVLVQKRHKSTSTVRFTYFGKQKKKNILFTLLNYWQIDILNM